MKTIYYSTVLIVVLCSNISFAQTENASIADSTGLPGDHFSLPGALALFKASSSLEDFEKRLNSEENVVNNLDLNGDGDIDYIRVIDNMQDSAHAIVLQVPVSETESQDVAVIELEKNGKESASVQIVGDEELYGDNSVVEPVEEHEGVEGGSGNNNKGPSAPLLSPRIRFVVNVWTWPCVNYVYAPAYVVWVSPWRWHRYPMWWKPWRPHPWRYHYTYCMHYHAFYRPAGMHRMVVAHRIYSPHRQTSVVVKNRYIVAHKNYRSNRPGTRQQNNSVAKKAGNRQANHAANQPRKAGADKAKQGGRSGGGRKTGGAGRK